MSQQKFLRVLGRWDATMLVVGCIVGVGIFRTASSIAGYVASPWLTLALWTVGGLVSLCGAVCYAQLAAAYPSSGGDYVYIREAYGPFWGFLFGWTKLFIERTGTIAILGFVFAEYARRLVPYDEATLRWVAAGAIALLTLVNVFGVKRGTWVQNVFTVLKIIALACLIVTGVIGFASPARAAVDWSVPVFTMTTVQSLGVAFVFVLWTFGGWTEATYVAEEVRDPARNIPRAVIGGVLLTTVLYVLVNWSYLMFIPAAVLPQTPMVASTVMQQAWGAGGATFIAVMVACSAFGALNGYILTGGRILYALGKDHALFTRLATVDEKFHTPAPALWANAGIAIALVFTKTFEQIMTYSTVVISVFFVMAVLSVFVRRPGHPRLPGPTGTRAGAGTRIWGYPATPLIFVVTMIGFILDVTIKQPAEALFGFGLLAVALPLYWLSNRCPSSSLR